MILFLALLLQCKLFFKVSGYYLFLRQCNTLFLQKQLDIDISSLEEVNGKCYWNHLKNVWIPFLLLNSGISEFNSSKTGTTGNAATLFNIPENISNQQTKSPFIRNYLNVRYCYDASRLNCCNIALAQQFHKLIDHWIIH